MANSEIARIGELQSGQHRLTIYTLWFVSPKTRHGMKHLAVVEGDKFLGSYIISHAVDPKIIDNRVEFTCEAGTACYGEPLVIDNGELPPRIWIDGEIAALEDAI